MICEQKKKVLIKISITVISVLITIILVFSFLAIYQVKGNSMLDSIAEGSYVVVDKSYFGSKRLEPKDIIVVNNTTNNTNFVKRIIGQEKDILKVSDQGISKGDYFIPHDPIFFSIKNNLESDVATCTEYANILYRNVEDIKNIFDFVSENNSVCEMYIPKGFYFVVGDNAFESMDSRFWGFVSEGQIHGKVIAVF